MPSRWAIVPLAALSIASAASFAGNSPVTASWRQTKTTAALAAPAPPNGAWTTYHRDNAHTGYDPLAPAVAGVAPTPGWAENTLDGSVYAEPLIYGGLVFAATLNNTVYALNQSTGAVVWQNHLGTPVSGGWACGNVSPQGILGTPVIDTIANRIYAVAEITGSPPLYHLFGLDLATGSAVINTTIAPGGFDWTIQQERGALALAGGQVYVPFGGRAGDCGSYHGWVVGVSTSGSTALNVYVTPGSGSGYWAAGGVTVDDSTGNVFVTSGNANTGNGCSSNADGSPQFENDAVARLSPSLAHLDFFMPQDWQAHWCSNDMDLGSAGPVLISPNLLFQSGKWGGGFLLNLSSLGGVDGQLFPTPRPAAYSQADVCFGNNSDATFGAFAYAAPFVYVECETHGLVALHVDTATSSFAPCDATCASPDWHAAPGVTLGPPIVAGGAVWAASDGGGLYAFDATTGAQIYHSAGFAVNRFVTPSEAGGQVFVPSATVIKSFTFAPAPPPPAAGAFTALDPKRLLDTRVSGGPLGPATRRNLAVTGGATGVPANATAVVMNVTVTDTTAPGFVTAYPDGWVPVASNLNWAAGQTVPNLVEVQVGAGGDVTFYNSAGSTDLVADLEGYFAPPAGSAGGEVALSPSRITDTRPSSGQANAGATLRASSMLTVQVTGAGGVPSTGVSAVVLNATVTDTTAASFLTLWPASQARPGTSNLNWLAGWTRANRVIVPVDSAGRVGVYNQFGSADVVLDVSGYFTTSPATGKLFTPVSPARIKDTRTSGQTLGPAGTITLQVSGVDGVPSSASAVIANVTVTNAGAPSYFTVYPSTASRPLASDLNWIAGQTIPNLTVASLGGTGAITIYNSTGSADVVVDLFGYFN